VQKISLLRLKDKFCRPFSRPIDSTTQGGHSIRPPLATSLDGLCLHDDLSTGSVIAGGILDQITDYQLLQNFSLILLNCLSIKHRQEQQYVATSQPLLRIHFNMFQPLEGNF
jgi:hypothetical protein